MKVAILRLKDILLTSIQVDLTDEEALQFQTDMMEKVKKTEAAGVIIDISALEVVDSFLARVLNETATMVRILGAEAVICGMQPEVALTLVEMGRELTDVMTAINLDHGMEKLREQIGKRGGD